MYMFVEPNKELTIVFADVNLCFCNKKQNITCTYWKRIVIKINSDKEIVN